MVDKFWYIVPTKEIVNILINKRGGGFNCKLNEVVLLGKVLCTKSRADMSWEFQPNTEYSLYYQIFDDKNYIYIVFNDSSGWYATYGNLENLVDSDFTFFLITE